MKAEVTPSRVHRVNTKEQKVRTIQKCHHGGGKHEASSCRFRDAQCFNCKKKGHLAKMCRGDKKTMTGGTHEPGKRYNKQGKERKQSTHLVKDSTNEDDVYSDYVPHTNGKQGKICLSGHRTLWRTT